MPPTDPPADQDRPDARGWRAAVAAAGVALLVVGALALAAWAGGAVEYVQIDTAAPPLHYNGAAAFVAWGLGLVALARGWLRAARAAGVAVTAAGVVLAAGNAPALGLGLDRWAAVPPPVGPVVAPSGVAPATVAALVLGGVGLVLSARRRATTRRTRVLTLIGAVLAAGGTAGLVSGGAVVVPGGVVRVSVLGGVGAAVGGLALLAAPLRRGPAPVALPALLPAAVGVLGLVFTVALWAGLSTEQAGRVNRQTQFEAAQAQKAVRDLLNAKVAALERGAREWAAGGPDKLREEAGSYLGLTPGCVGVAHVRADGRVAWVELRGTVPLPGTLAELGAADAVAAGVRDGRVAAARPPRSRWHGARVLVVFAPTRPGEADSDGLLAVFLLREFLASALNDNVAPGYAVTVADGPDEVFARFTAGPAGDARWKQPLPVEFAGERWQMTAWPTREVLERENLSLPRLAAVVGVSTTALLALAVHLALTARRRTRALEAEVRERELAQLALTDSERKYRTLIENLGQGIFLLDHDQRFVAANPEFCRSTGLAEGDVLGRTPADLLDPRLAARFAEDVNTVFADGKSVDGEEDRTAGGRRTVVRRVLTPVRDAAGFTTGVLGIVWDVTEQRLLEAHVNQASKMDAIGQLAGGIAHDFNNLLTGILGNLELILADPATKAGTRELAEAAQNAATRAASLTKRLLGFARRHQLDWVPTDPAAIVEEVVTLLRRTIDPLVRIETRCPADTWLVQADPAQLNQVLMNLCLNARDAIAGAGQITVETACLTAAQLPPGHGRGVRSGDYVRLSVTDTGAGMTDEVKARIYEPFFTTKGVGKGTGLGLPSAFASVRQHNGWIDCWSEVGRGTRFDVYLPRAAAAAKPTGSRVEAPPPARVGKERILVVDDEAMIRRLAVMTLQGRGYRVLEAADGQQAVDVYTRERDRIDLVVLDLSMPVLSGHETFRLLLKLDPRVRVLFASGYSAEQLSDLEKGLMAGFVSKPYRPHELVGAVEAALRTSAPRGSEPAGRSSEHRMPALSVG